MSGFATGPEGPEPNFKESSEQSTQKFGIFACAWLPNMLLLTAAAAADNDDIYTTSQ